MSQANFEQWQKNLELKIQEVEKEIYRFISSDPGPLSAVQDVNRKNSYARALQEVSNLAAMYGSGNLPQEINQLRIEVEYLHNNRNLPAALNDLLAAIRSVKKIPRTGMSFISFHDIYEQYREDGELNDLIDQLVQTLEKIIAEDDGTLSSRVEKDINRLLDQIRNRPKLSTYEIGAWSELTGRFLLELVGQQQGVPALSLVIDGIKLSKKVFDNVFEKYQQSQSEYVRLIGLKTAPADFSSLPQLNDATIGAAEIRLAALAAPKALPYDGETPRPTDSAPKVPPSP